MTVLVTGAAGFIGSFVASRMARHGHSVHGCDNFNAYYDPALKRARVAHLLAPRGVGCDAVELADAAAVRALFDRVNPSVVIHLAAQAGVRYSIDHPETYVQSNLVGFANMLEACRHHRVQHLVYASSSSVYGDRTDPPFREAQNTDSPVSLYAATKKANELMAHSYSHLYRLPATGLRFFTVYGTWGRPDMALYTFAKAIVEGSPIRLFNYGRMRRDFTYVDDVVEAVERLIGKPPAPSKASPDGELDPATSAAPWRIYNIGNNTSVEVSRLVELLEQEFGRKARTELVPMQPGDVPETRADVDDLMREVGFRPATPIEEGVRRFAAWFREFFKGR